MNAGQGARNRLNCRRGLALRKPPRADARSLRTAIVALSATALLTLGAAPAAPAFAANPVPAGALHVSPDALVSSSGRVITPQAAAATGAGDRGRTGFVGRSPSPETIILNDDRVRITPTTSYPARANGLINRNGSLHCTGWLVSRDTILTAGHCVHTGGSSGSWYSGLTFLAGSDGGTAPYGTCSPRSTWALNGWLNRGDPQYDAAVIKLDCTVGTTVGWYGMWWQSASLDGELTVVQGYPGDKPSEQWQAVDYVRASETQRVYYQNDTLGGESGSAVWQSRDWWRPACTGVCAMAIHTYGTGGSAPGATNNSGTRITQAKYNTFVSIINMP
jgi:glutamyl endopeptidase